MAAEQKTTVETLGNILIGLFSSYVGTEEESLLEESLFINNIIAESDFHSCFDYDKLPQDVWDDAWNRFEEFVNGRN